MATDLHDLGFFSIASCVSLNSSLSNSERLDVTVVVVCVSLTTGESVLGGIVVSPPAPDSALAVATWYSSYALMYGYL